MNKTKYELRQLKTGKYAVFIITLKLQNYLTLITEQRNYRYGQWGGGSTQKRAVECICRKTSLSRRVDRCAVGGHI